MYVTPHSSMSLEELKSQEPLDIVRCLLAKYSVFDEDLKRLESSGRDTNSSQATPNVPTTPNSVVITPSSPSVNKGECSINSKPSGNNQTVVVVYHVSIPAPSSPALKKLLKVSTIPPVKMPTAVVENVTPIVVSLVETICHVTSKRVTTTHSPPADTKASMEARITLERFVIDCGRVKARIHVPATGMDILRA